MTTRAPLSGQETLDLDVAGGSENDPRCEAFAAFLRAKDQADWKAGLLATRRLRALGFSVVMVTPSSTSGGRRC